MKIILVGYSGSQKIVPASKYLTGKYLPGFDITYLNYEGPVDEWAEYLAKYLSNIKDKHIIFSLDDYLISGPIDAQQFKLAESYIKNNPEVRCIKLCHSTPEEHLEYPCTTQYTIWDRDYLIWLLIQIKIPIKNPWQFEIHGSKLITGVMHIPCIEYFGNSSISARWEGVNLTGLIQEDIDYMTNQSLLPKEEKEVYQARGILPGITQAKTVVFGASGFLGVHLVARLISMGRTNILAVSRNESQLVSLKEKFPDIQIMVGDISDPWTVKSAMTGAYECYVLAAMKHVGLSETAVNACILTNIVGMMNIMNESLQSKPKVLMFISSDKAAQGTGVYGCSKKIGERLMAEAETMNPETKYRVVRYGNVFGSSGSFITKWIPKMQKGEEIILTDPEATRFFWTVQESVDLIFECIEKAEDCTPFVPKMKAVSMGTVLEAAMEVYGKSPVKIIGLQPGENKHETTDGVIFSDTCEQFSKSEFISKFLLNEADQKIGMPGTPGVDGHPKISCILITRHKEYPQMVLERLDLPGFFDEIIIVTECPSVYHRYLAAMKAKNEIIYVQDDDCMVNFQVLFSKYNGQITNAMTKPFIEKYKDIDCTLIGWGAFFPKSMLSVFDRYISKYGVDAHLLREADRIFTSLNKPWNTINMPHEDLDQTPDRMGYQPDHYTSMNEALEKCKKL